MELAFLLRDVNTRVVWVTYQKYNEPEVISSLERRLTDRGVEVICSNSREAIDIAIEESDIVILNTAVTGKWVDEVLNENATRVLYKVLWWIHEIHEMYFSPEYIHHLPSVAAVAIVSYVGAEYWKNATRDQLRIKMPETFVVHLGNRKELMEIAENSVAKKVLREHIRESLGVQEDDILLGIINSVTVIKGQDLFLESFHEALQLSRQRNLKIPKMYAIIVGGDLRGESEFEKQLHEFAAEKKIQESVIFVKKTQSVAPYLASIDVLIQNTPGCGESFGRITIEAMAFGLPVLGADAGGTREIVVNGTTGLLHPPGKNGVTELAENIIQLATNEELRRSMGIQGYNRVQERFLEQHMSNRISLALKKVLEKINDRAEQST